MEISVGWNGQKLKVQADPTKPIGDIMSQLEAQTKVPVERQKLLMRRKQLKPDEFFAEGELKPTTRLMLFGSPEEAVVIRELSPEELIDESAEPAIDPAVYTGLTNYGNTCYLNACLEVIRHLPKFADRIKNLEPEGSAGPAAVTRTLSLFLRNFPTYLPQLVKSIRTANPAFAVLENGVYQQQDGAECWGFIMQILKQFIPMAVQESFEIEYKVTTTCNEDPSIVEHSTEVDDRLRCFIDQDTKHIQTGIKMDSSLEKQCDQLGHVAEWTVSREINALPRYLTIQMMRFTYKQEEQTTAKIVRRVEHPMRFDVLDWLSPELRTKAVQARETGTQGRNPTGMYRLKAILTHRGRSANSGHYISHVRIGEEWLRYDDDKVKVVDEDAIQALNGAADWHCSYLLFYEAE